ncbi:MAG: cell division protein FtsZ [Alphaproteobacteria bacterium]|nr:cell division protein FtsZ [Alphaproteobacteria bacterium]
MSINLHLPSQLDTLKPKITVIGVGGAGGNAVNNMIAANLEGVDFVNANTDAQALEGSLTERIVQLGASVTRGLGAGANPNMGRQAAEEASDDIAQLIEGSNMVFIAAGMGGGTGTGAAPVIARLAKEQGVLTVGIVTKPFQFEGAHRMKMAEAGIKELQEYVDTLIVIPNQNLFRIANEKTTFAEAFRLADEVLHSGVRGVTDLMVKPGLVNLDFADIRSVMSEMGKAMMGTGEAVGERRALEAAEAAISNPLLDDVSLKGARAVLINITGGPDMTLFEVDEAANRIRDEVDPEANIIFGSTFSDALQGRMRVSVVATGIDAAELALRPKQPEQLAASVSQASKKPLMFGSKKAEVTLPPAPTRERTAAEIVRQASVSVPRAAAPSVHTVPSVATAPAAAQPVVRIIDENVRAEDELRAKLDAQAAAQAQARVDEAMRIAAQAKSAAPIHDDAGPLFMSPKPEMPAQRMVHTAASPILEDEEITSESTSNAAGGLFGRLASVGKAFTVKAEPRAREVQVSAGNEATARKAEVRETPSASAEEEEFYDIPAFLRRQAN